MCVCVCVCTHAHMHTHRGFPIANRHPVCVCVCVCTHAHMHTCTHTGAFLSQTCMLHAGRHHVGYGLLLLETYMGAYIYIYMYICIYINHLRWCVYKLYIYTCIHVYMHTCVHVYMYIYISFVFLLVCVCVCCVCVCVCVCVRAYQGRVSSPRWSIGKCRALN